MTVTIIKPKAKDVSKIDSEQVVPAETVDEYAVAAAKLEKRAEKLKPLQKQVKDLELGIIGAVDEVIDPGTKFNLTGNDFELQLGAQGQRAEITNMELAVDLLGEDLFLKLAKISITDLKAYLTPDQLAQVTKSNYKIKRRIKVVTL